MFTLLLVSLLISATVLLILVVCVPAFIVFHIRRTHKKGSKSRQKFTQDPLYLDWKKQQDQLDTWRQAHERPLTLDEKRELEQFKFSAKGAHMAYWWEHATPSSHWNNRLRIKQDRDS